MIMNDDELLSIGNITYYISKAKEGEPDPEGSRDLLRLFCARAKLRSLDSPSDGLLRFISSAFEKYLSGEEKDLAKSLGLKKVGKPVNREIERRNVFIAFDVLCLHRSGKPLLGNRDERGAFSTIAEQRDLSDNQVRDIYYAYQDKALLMEKFMQQIEGD